MKLNLTKIVLSSIVLIISFASLNLFAFDIINNLDQTLGTSLVQSDLSKPLKGLIISPNESEQIDTNKYSGLIINNYPAK